MTRAYLVDLDACPQERLTLFARGLGERLLDVTARDLRSTSAERRRAARAFVKESALFQVACMYWCGLEPGYVARLYKMIRRRSNHR